MDTDPSFMYGIFTPKEGFSKERIKEWIETPLHIHVREYNYENYTDEVALKVREKKFLLLFDYFKIPRGHWEELARAIAFEFLAGFQAVDGEPLKKRGQPAKWPPLKLHELMLAVDEIKKSSDTKLSDRQAVLRLLKKEPEKWGQRSTAAQERERAFINLYKRLSEAKRNARSDHYEDILNG